MAGYTLFFAVILLGVAALFWERLKIVQEREVHEVLDRQFAAMKGYLRIDQDPDNPGKNVAAWYYDENDVDESTSILDFKKIYMIADQNGKLIDEWSTDEPA